MEQFTSLQYAILTKLSEHNDQSGNTLGQALGVSRTAIWKNIKILIQLGFPIEVLAKRGYRLNPRIKLLDPEKIEEELVKKGFKTPFHLYYFASIDSTNKFLKNKNERSAICLAEGQTQGRGRFGRHWYSPFGENIYCSSRWQLEADISQLSGLSLVVGLAILKTLSSFAGAEKCLLKWPNDILWEGKKLGGILIEIFAESHGVTEVIIGIGLNINSDTSKGTIDEKPWCSLCDITGKVEDRSAIISSLLVHLEAHIEKFIRLGFGAFKEEWEEKDYLKGNIIKLTHAGKAIQGEALGLNARGELLLRDAQELVHVIGAGEASLSGSPKG